ncbi:hypothetical protein FACS18942_04450 [Planctomycetales bacterium]|nr:hypothetical protein FACS18942_04450 [Planctomycetales bacterium]
MFLSGQNTSVAANTEQKTVETKESGTADKGTDAGNNVEEKNTVKQKRPPRKKKEINFDDSNATSFSIQGLEDTASVPDEIRFAGTSGTGKKIAFVIDSTAIMGGGASTPWSFACDELAFSFKDLNDTQSFQVFFFAKEPDYLQSAQGEAQWISSAPQNKKESFDFLKKHTPSGSGSAFAALKEALTLKPDAVFFLTTQKSTPLSEAQTEALKTLLGTLPKTVPIHTAEIGEGMENSEKSSFQKLAEITKGQYRWVNANIRGLKF